MTIFPFLQVIIDTNKIQSGLMKSASKRDLLQIILLLTGVP